MSIAFAFLKCFVVSVFCKYDLSQLWLSVAVYKASNYTVFHKKWTPFSFFRNSLK